ncbi:hypothetical protein ILUMI_23215 [Ignelater luminosus]|uniref:HTH psq-type domain-containing protein n=1 Tax=Ignelater luminosus TaxID=2038154 RepID=A0A8K0FZU9_IGNLU|nr:hypothetical protein ILUMI_23215 [Ignelater luminosus]
MTAAINAIRNGISKKKAATTFKIPRSSLQFRMGNNFKKVTKGPPSVLTADEENTLVRWINTCILEPDEELIAVLSRCTNQAEPSNEHFTTEYLKDYKAPDNIICLPSTSKAPSTENIIFQDLEIKVTEDNIQEEHISPDDILENKIQNHENLHRPTPKTPFIKS